MKYIHILPLFLVLALAACSGKDDSKKGDDPSGGLWEHAAPRVSKVEVSSGGSPVETYEYTYDEKGRMLTLVKTDKISGTVMLDLRYTYPSDNEMRITGKFFPITSNRFITVKYDADARTVVYQGSWDGSWQYTARLDGAGGLKALEMNSDFAAKDGYYSSGMYYNEAYTVSDGTVTTAEMLTDIKAKSSRSTESENNSSLVVNYTPSASADRQNFAAYLMPCDFPVWVACGLPGNKKLIQEITRKTGSIPSPQSTGLSYTQNTSGDIETVTRTDNNAGVAYLERTYRFYYQ